MLRKCAICAKVRMIGKNVVRKGLAKKKGGTGSKIVRRTRRIFSANLQKIRILINNRPTRAFVCTKCLKKGAVQKA